MANDLNVVYRISADIAGLKDGINKAVQTTGALEKSATSLGTSFDASFNKIAASSKRGIGTVTAELLLAQKEVANLQKLVLKNADKPGFVSALGYELDAAIPKVSALERELSSLQTKVVTTGGPTQALGGFFGDLSKSIVSTAAGFISAQAVLGAFSTGFHTLTGFVSDSIESYAKAESAQKKLTTALQAQGQATPGTIKAYNDLATTFQKTTGYSDDLITSMEALLVQVGHVMPDQMQAALTASTDLASGLGIDLETATNLMAKAAAGHTETLARYGITVEHSSDQTQQFQNVLEAINQQFGGQAAAQIETYAGSIQQMANAWDNVKEAVGKAIVDDPLIQAALHRVADAANAADSSASTFSGTIIDLVVQSHALPSALGDVLDYYERVAQAQRALANQNKDIANYFASLRRLQGGLSVFPSTIQGTGIPESEREKLDAQFRADQKRAIAEQAAFEQRINEDTSKRLQKIYDEIGKSFADMMKDQQRQLKITNQATIDLVASLAHMRDVQRENFGPTHAFLEGIEKVGLAEKITNEQIEKSLALYSDYGPTLEQLTRDDGSLADQAQRTATSIGKISGAFSELAQISDGAMSGVARAMGVGISAINTAITSVSNLGTGFLSLAAGAAGFIGAFVQLGSTINQLTGPFDNSVTHMRDLVKALADTGESLASFVQRAHDAGISLDALFHAKNAQAFQTELAKVQQQLAGIGQAGADAAAKITDAIHSQGFQSQTEIKQAADIANQAYQQMLKSQDFTADQVDKAYRHYQELLAQLEGAAGEAARAWLKAHQEADAAVEASSDAMKSAENDLKALLSKRDSLAAGIAAEAPEAVMGVIESQQRGELKALDGEIQRKADDYAKLAKETGQEMAQAIIDALSRIHIDPLHIGVILDGAGGGIVAGGPDPGSYHPGPRVPGGTGYVPSDRFAGLDYNTYFRDYWAPDRAEVLANIPHASMGGMVRDWGIEHFTTGGIVGRDTVPTMLTPGEMVLTHDQQGWVGAAMAGSDQPIQVAVTVQSLLDGAVVAENTITRIARDKRGAGTKAKRALGI